MRERFGLRLRVAAFFAALGLGGALIVAAALWFGWQRAGGPAAGYLTAGLIAGFGIVGLSAWIGFLFDENVARPILGLSNDLDARAATEVDADVNQTPGRYLGRLAPAVGAVHQALNEARAERDAAVAAETARIERDRTLLSALIRDMAQAVMVVSDEGRILLFNDAAVRLLGPLSLDRPLHRFMLIEPFAHRLGAGESDERVASFLSSSLADDQLITGKISAFGAADGLIGHLIVCDAATEHLRGQAASDRAVAQLLEKVRRPTMNLGAMLDVMGEGEELTTRMRGEVASLGSAVVAASTDMNTAA
ncbi:MAG: PAS domain-containing protein, partial [Pseudomonadota bacterium]